MNILIILLMAIISVVYLYISQLIFDKNAIKITYIIYNIIAYLLSFKIFEILNINLNANIVMISIFISLTYLIIEKSSIKEYKETVINIFISISLLILSSYLGAITDTNSVDMKTVFLNNYKILISYPITTLLTQLLTLCIYQNVKEVTPNITKNIIISNLTVIIIDTFIFCILSYLFEFKLNQILILVTNNYIIKVILSSIFTPFIVPLINSKKVKL